MKKSVITGALCALLSGMLLPSTSFAGDVAVGGTGMALKLLERVGASVQAENPNVTVTVLPSMGSGGGLKALADGVLDLSLSARALKGTELEAGLEEKYCFATPLVFATQRENAADVTLSRLIDIYASPSPYWPNGVPLKVIMRTRSGSEHPYLAGKIEGLEKSFALARSRPDVVLGMTDQQNLDIAEKMFGAFAITTMLQIATEERKIVPVSVDGVQPGPDTLADSTYPFSMTVCVVGRKMIRGYDAPLLLEYLESDAGMKLVRNAGALPIGRHR
jgi:phosphate transport system substrate-binding protein